MTTTAHGAPLGSTGWYLVGRPLGSTSCDHCGRTLKHCYRVVNSDAVEMTVGRGCVKKLTGWTLTAAMAEGLLRIAERNAARAVQWAKFAAEYPGPAQTILNDCAAAEAQPGMTYNASHEIKDRMSDGWDVEEFLPYYLRKRSELWWIK